MLSCNYVIVIPDLADIIFTLCKQILTVKKVHKAKRICFRRSMIRKAVRKCDHPREEDTLERTVKALVGEEVGIAGR